MRLSIVRAGRTDTVEIDMAARTVRVGEKTYPFEIVDAGPQKVVLEIAGEPVVVDAWPQGFAAPPGPVDVNGERWPIDEIRREGGPAPTPRAPPLARSVAPAPASAEVGPGTAIVPPMPGRVIEVRAKDGEQVRAGQVLVVVEAMKMRNEVASPIDGRVAQVSVRPGANVRAKETMLRVVAEPPP